MYRRPLRKPARRSTILYSTAPVRIRTPGTRARPTTIFRRNKDSHSASTISRPRRLMFLPIRCSPTTPRRSNKGKTDNLTGQLSHLFTISSRMVNEFRVGASRELDKYKPPSLGKNDPTTLGLQPPTARILRPMCFPHISIDQGAQVGGWPWVLAAATATLTPFSVRESTTSPTCSR